MCCFGTWNENTGTSPCLAVIKLFRKSLLQSHSKVNLSPPLNNRPPIPYHSKSFKKRTPDAIVAAYQKVQYGASKTKEVFHFLSCSIFHFLSCSRRFAFLRFRSQAQCNNQTKRNDENHWTEPTWYHVNVTMIDETQPIPDRFMNK